MVWLLIVETVRASMAMIRTGRMKRSIIVKNLAVTPREVDRRWEMGKGISLKKKESKAEVFNHASRKLSPKIDWTISPPLTARTERRVSLSP